MAFAKKVDEVNSLVNNYIKKFNKFSKNADIMLDKLYTIDIDIMLKEK